MKKIIFFFCLPILHACACILTVGLCKRKKCKSHESRQEKENQGKKEEEERKPCRITHISANATRKDEPPGASVGDTKITRDPHEEGKEELPVQLQKYMQGRHF